MYTWVIYDNDTPIVVVDEEGAAVFACECHRNAHAAPGVRRGCARPLDSLVEELARRKAAARSTR